MAVAVVNQQPQEKINIDLSDSKVALVTSKKETKEEINNTKENPSKKEEKKDEKTPLPKEDKKEVKKKEEVEPTTSKKEKEEALKKEIAKETPSIKEVKLPVNKEEVKNSKKDNSSDFASEVNRNLYEYESLKENQSKAMKEAIALHNGDPSNTCVFFQGACLRAIGVPVPSHIGYTSNLWNWLEKNNWEMHRDFSNIQKGDIIFAGEYHTMCFMGWKDKKNGIAYVMGNEAYLYGDSYANRNLNGQAPTKANGYTRQFKATRYYKFKGSSKGNLEKTNIVKTKPLENKDFKFKVEALKGYVVAKQDVYINEKPLPTTEGAKALGLASKGDKLQVTGRADNGWYEVSYKGNKAYISHRYTDFLEEKEEASKASDSKVELIKTTKKDKSSNKEEAPKLEVKKEENKASDKREEVEKNSFVKANGGLWLHSKKDTSYSSRITLMNNGAKVKVLEEGSSWFKVDFKGDIGWCSNQYLSTPIPTENTKSKKEEEIKPSKPSKVLEDKKETNKPTLTKVKTASIKAKGGLWLHSSKNSLISSRLEIMDKGETVTILEEKGEWFKVNFKGKTGFCASQYLSEATTYEKEAEPNKIEEVKKESPSKAVEESKPIKTLEENKPKKEEETSKPTLTNIKKASIKAKGGLWLHSTKDSSASSRITIMGNGEKVDILDESGSFFKVNYNGTMGWCSSQFLNNITSIPQNSQSKAVEENKQVYENKKVEIAKPVTSTVKTAYIKAKGGLWLHSSKNSYASSRITIMGNGEKVKVLEESGSFIKVDHNGNIGWCSSEFLTAPVASEGNTLEVSKIVKSNKSEASLREGYIKANGGLWLHSSKDSSTSSRLTVISNGHKVEILEESGDWVKVKYNGITGWCAKRYVS